jgi:hypothetical protein
MNGDAITLDMLASIAGQAAAIALLIGAAKMVGAPLSGHVTQAIALLLGIGLQVAVASFNGAWVANGYAQTGILAVLNGVTAGLAAMQGRDFVRGGKAEPGIPTLRAEK